MKESESYFGSELNVVRLKLHRLRYENIHEIKPVIENPMNMPKMNEHFLEILEVEPSKYI